ncbi:dehydrogenase [Sulfolobus metallicus DSM 6482 = JCM 9184]|uniref:Dehydrogenase n=2 Tax=Sulfuracidifex metallicus TaxID=47303 RepID=A0A6A9QMS7_SULME|nr:dehydrogenase [Sulfuracidifex metallicus DSM 6482 = JCM 9184]
MRKMMSLIDRSLLYEFYSDLFIYKWDEEEYSSFVQRVKDVDSTYTNLRPLTSKILNASRKDLLVEYSSLFLTGTGSRPLTPVESKRIFSIMGEKIALSKYKDLLSFYDSWGLKPKSVGNFFQPEADHISSILAFMAFLISKENETTAEGRKPLRSMSDQKLFFFNHVLSWIPSWANDVIKDKRSNLFGVACSSLNQWIEQEKIRLGL